MTSTSSGQQRNRPSRGGGARGRLRARLLGGIALAGVLIAGCGSQKPTISKAPAISGTAVYQARLASSRPRHAPVDILIANTGTWSHARTFTYQWEDCDSSGGNCTAIGGATATRYAIRAANVGQMIRVVVVAHNGQASTAAVSAATAVVTTSAAPTVNYYVAQTSHGSGSGSSCGNAGPVSSLSTTTEWTPGNVIGLCGKITSEIVALGSGSRGKPITLYFEPGASISQPACPTACLTLSNESYIIVDGGQNGVIENTANGTGLGNSVGDQGIAADPCPNCTIENLTIRNIYVRRSQSDTTAGAANSACMTVSGSNLTVANNTMEFAHWCVNLDENNHPMDTNLRFYGNDISQTDHGFVLEFYNNPGGAGLGPFYFYANHVHDYAVWDTSAADDYHHDGLHCYSSGTGQPDIGGGLYIYDNVWGGNVGQNDTAQIFLEGTPDGTPCSTTSSPIWIFNNVVEGSRYGTPTNDYLTLSAGTEHILNNTILGDGGSCLVYNNDSSTATVENNVISDCSQEISNTGHTNGPVSADHNIFADGQGSNTYVCKGNYFAANRFPSWQSCIGGDSHSSAPASAGVNSDGTLQADSPAAGAGANLHSLCIGQPNPGLGALCESINGTSRSSTGAWNAGAY